MSNQQQSQRTKNQNITQKSAPEKAKGANANQRSPNAPTHELFSVIRREGSDKGIWHKVGGCWPHEDGDGFTVRLDYLPLNGGELVMRKWKPKAETTSNDALEGGVA